VIGAVPTVARITYLVVLKGRDANSGGSGLRSTAMGELSGKVAIVTGASKGIGAAIARRFGEAGAAVAVNYASDKAGADRLVERIKRDGGKAVAIQADVSKSADVQRLFAETKSRLGAPSILVNNAGVFSFAPIEAVTEEDVERQFGINVLGTLLASKEAVAAFDGAGGSIINLSTIASVNPVPNSVVYSSSKAAVDTITRALAVELAPKKIRVNAIAPGATETEGTKTMGLTMEAAKSMGMVMPMGRMGQPDDIARVALFLASDQSSWLTGERISASGGQR
jgi:3-oxoacyl-[acyl-carrier protein] reductase